MLAVKENQGNLLAEVKDSFQMLAADAVIEDVDCGHGRVEQRKCSVIGDVSLVEKAAEWASLQGLVRIEAQRYHKTTSKTEREIRYYITSLKPDTARLNRVVRQHWGIENKLHWVLDVGFGEDLSRKRAGHAAQNFSLLNRIALNTLKQEKSSLPAQITRDLNASALTNHRYSEPTPLGWTNIALGHRGQTQRSGRRTLRSGTGHLAIDLAMRVFIPRTLIRGLIRIETRFCASLHRSNSQGG